MNKYVVIVVAVFSFVIVPPCLSEGLPRIPHRLRPRGDGSLRFLGIGDWGRGGEFSQNKIAKQMGKVAKNYRIEFIISTGDNFYAYGSHRDGLYSVDDDAFTESFKDIYTAKSLRKLPWYTGTFEQLYRNFDLVVVE